MCAICHTPPKKTLSHWFFFMGYVPLLKLRLVLKLSDEKNANDFSKKSAKKLDSNFMGTTVSPGKTAAGLQLASF